MGTNHVISLVSKIREKANGLITAELEQRGHPGLAPSHGAILARLYDLGPLPMGELARTIGRQKNTVTVLVRKMEQAGYVRRKPFPEDSRVTLVELTDKGEAFRKDFGQVSEKLLSTVWHGMDTARQERLVRDLETVLGNLE